MVSNVRFVQNVALGGTWCRRPVVQCFTRVRLVPVDFSFIDLLEQSSGGPFPFAATRDADTHADGRTSLPSGRRCGNQTVPDPLPGTGYDYRSTCRRSPPGGTAHLLFTDDRELTFDFTNHIELFADGLVLAPRRTLPDVAEFVRRGREHHHARLEPIVKHDFALAVTACRLSRRIVLYGVQRDADAVRSQLPVRRQPVVSLDESRGCRRRIARWIDGAARPLRTLAPGAQLDQFWYRDPSSGIAGPSLSDAIEVTFCPWPAARNRSDPRALAGPIAGRRCARCTSSRSGAFAILVSDPYGGRLQHQLARRLVEHFP